MQKKRILCLIDSLGLGGAQRQMIGLVDLLRKKGYMADLAIYHKRIFYQHLLDELQIPVITLAHGGSRWSKLNAVRKLIRKNHYDVVITYMTGANVIGALLKWSGMSFKLIVSDRTTNMKRSRRDDLIYAICRKADFVVPNSFSQAEFLSKNYPYLASRIHTITNFTDPQFSPIAPQPEHPQLRLLGAGRLSREKNILTLIQAIRLLKDRDIQVQLTWYGDTCRMAGSDEYRQDLETAIHTLGVQNQVRICPAIPHLIEAYHACDAFCLPSFSEGFPNTVCEAMSCGKPILCSNVCDNPRIVEEGINGFLFTPESATMIADTIQKFWHLPYEQRLQMGVKSRELSLQRFSTERFVEQYITLIEN